MQVPQGQVLVSVYALVQVAIGWCILLLLVPKMVLTLCNLHWWCFFYANWPIYILMCTNTLVRFSTCTVWFWRYVYICVCVCVRGVRVHVCVCLYVHNTVWHVMKVRAVCHGIYIIVFCGVTCTAW